MSAEHWGESGCQDYKGLRDAKFMTGKPTETAELTLH